MSQRSSRLIDKFKPFTDLIPRVNKSPTQKPFEEKVVWTALVLFIYSICCHIPLFGATASNTTESYQWVRMLIASNKGSLMDLGISQIVTAGMLLQVLTSLKIIDVEMTDEEDRDLYNGVEKFLGFVLSFGEALVMIFSGNYGTMDSLGYSGVLMLLFQLVFSGMLVVLMDDLLQKGYGLGSGLNLFIVYNICEAIFWQCFNPITVSVGSEVQFQGAVIYLVHSIISKKNKIAALTDGMFREHAPNMSNVIATVLIFFIVIYFNGFRHEIKLVNTKLRGINQTYPVKLFYTSSIPIFLLSLVVTAIMGLSQLLYRQFRGYSIVNLLGKWQEINGVGVPISGFAYFISPPKNIIEFLRDPLRSLFYTCFVLVVCASLSRLYIVITGENGSKIYRHFKAENFKVKNKDRDEEAIKLLNKLTTYSSIIGGLCVGMLTILAELLGALGGGTGLLLCASILTKFVENFFTENKRRAEME